MLEFLTQPVTVAVLIPAVILLGAYYIAHRQ